MPKIRVDECLNFAPIRRTYAKIRHFCEQYCVIMTRFEIAIFWVNTSPTGEESARCQPLPHFSPAFVARCVRRSEMWRHLGKGGMVCAMFAADSAPQQIAGEKISLFVFSSRDYATMMTGQKAVDQKGITNDTYLVSHHWFGSRIHRRKVDARRRIWSRRQSHRRRHRSCAWRLCIWPVGDIGRRRSCWVACHSLGGGGHLAVPNRADQKIGPHRNDVTFLCGRFKGSRNNTSISVLIHVHVLLWVRERTARSLDAFFELLRQVKAHSPVVGCRTPWAYDELNR